MLKSEHQHTVTWSAARWPPSRSCYRPAVLFLLLPIICAFILATKNRRAFKNVLFENVLHFKNSVSLKLRNLKLRRSGSDVNITNDGMKPKLHLQGRWQQSMFR